MSQITLIYEKNLGAMMSEPTIIKKYSNRRLYNTATSTYVTLDYLAEMVKNGEEFVVKDAKSGEDLTHNILTQIIAELENKGQNLLPTPFLRQLIQFYGDSLEGVLPSYLENAMDSFSNNQHKIREYVEGTLNAWMPYANMDEWQKQQKSFMDNAFSLFMPQQPKEKNVDALQKQLDEMKAELDKLKSSDS